MPCIFQKLFFAAAVVPLFTGRVCAQQSLSADIAGGATSSTNMLQPVSKTWKDNMLERQFRSSATKSFDFGASSLSGVAVTPRPSIHDETESPSAKRRREQLEQMKFLMLMNADAPSKDITVDDLMNLQGLEAETVVSGSPLEQLYLKQLQKERSAASNYARAELDFRNNSDPLSIPGSENRNSSVQANSFLKNSTDLNRAAPAGRSIFPDLFNPPASSANNLRLQQAHANEFRRTLDTRPSGVSPSWNSGNDSARSPSGVGRTLNNFSTPASTFSGQPNAGASPVVPPPPVVSPASQPQQQFKTPPTTYTPPRRRF